MAGKQKGVITVQKEGDRVVLDLTTEDPDVMLDDAWDLFFDFRAPAERHRMHSRGVFFGRVLVKDGSWNPCVLSGTQLPQPPIQTTLRKEGNRNTIRLSFAANEAAQMGNTAGTDFGFAAVLLAADEDGKRPFRKPPWVNGALPDKGYLNCTDLVYVMPEDWQTFAMNGTNVRTVPLPAIQPLKNAPAIAVKWGNLPEPYNTEPSTKNYEDKNKPSNFDFSSFDGNRTWRRLTSANNTALAVMAIRPNLGVPATREHPITGQTVPREWARQLSAEGGATQAWTMDFVPHSDPGYYDYADDSGLRTFAISTHPNHGNLSGYMPALGTWYVQPQGDGCNCQINVQTSLVFAPAEKRSNEDWGTFWSDGKEGLPVRSLHLNFAALGDRRDDLKNLWLGFPRAERPAEGYSMAIANGTPTLMGAPFIPEFGPGGKPFSFNADHTPVEGTTMPWIYCSGFRDLRKATVDTLFYQPGITFLAIPTAQPPVIDGKLDDSCWDGSGCVFVAAKSNVYSPGGNPLYLRYDEKCLYVAWSGLKTFQPPTAQGDENKFWESADRMAIGLLDQRADKWLIFGLAADGSRYDARAAIPPDGKVLLDPTWTGDWNARVGPAEDGGSNVEIAIPWKTIADAGLKKEDLRFRFVTTPNDSELASARKKYQPGLQFAPAPAAAASYTVRMHFMEPDDVQPGARVFDVKLNGMTVAQDLDIVKESGGRFTALVKEYKGVKATGLVTLEFVPKAGEPVISGLEIRAE